MKTRTGMSLGLALTLMVGVFATMLALGLFTNNEVRAASVANPTVSSTVSEIDEFTEVTVGFDTATILPAGGTIKIVFPDSMVVPSFNEVESEVNARVTVDIASAGATFAMSSTKGQTITVTTTTEAAVGASVSVVLPIQTTTATPPTMIGIRNPNVVGAYSVMISTSTDVDAVPAANATAADLGTPGNRDDVYAVSVEHTPEGTDANARITVDFYSPAPLVANLDTITIEFADDVQVPAVLDERFISVVGEATGITGVTVANPLDVTVQYVGIPADEPRITLTLGDHNPDDGAVGGIDAGKVTVIFRQGAGIKNPTEAGTWNVKVQTSKDPKDVASLGKRGFATIRFLSLSSKDGSRGSTVTVTGKGFKNSTDVTVWLDENADGTKDLGEVELCFAGVGGTDTFTCDFKVNASNFSPAGTAKTISAVDGRAGADQNTKSATWTLKGQVKAVPKSAAIGDKVTIEFRDFPDDEPITTFKLGGENILSQLGSNFRPEDSASATITIPDGLALGRQSLAAATAGSGTRRVTMTILGAQLSVSPSEVVPNQSVTITGRGYSGNGFLVDSEGASGVEAPAENSSEILIGGTKIDFDKIDDGDRVDIDSGGSWVATVVIPVKTPAIVPGTYELKVVDNKGRPGVAQITLKDRTVDFDPKESRSGTTVTVSGRGWIATNSAGITAGIDVDYDAGDNNTSSSRATPDSDGNFTTTILVPRNAPIPSTNTVTVSYDDESEDPVTETFSHRVPEAGLEISPVSGPGGTIATLTGGGFKAFTSMKEVSVGGLEVQPKPAGPSSDRDGILATSTILIPGLDPGTHTVKATVGDAVVSVAFTITDEDALPPPAEDQPTAEAFAALIDSGNLIGVFRYDDEAQAYQTYDPDPANAGFNNLDTVSSGDIFWVRLREDQTFLGKLRRAEWAQVVLP